MNCIEFLLPAKPEVFTEVDDEILKLSEKLFSASTPNILNQISVNLQQKTKSSSQDDDAPDPYVFHCPSLWSLLIYFTLTQTFDSERNHIGQNTNNCEIASTFR